MNPLRNLLAKLRRPAEHADAAPRREHAPTNVHAGSSHDPDSLTHAQDKRRLERLLRDRGMTRTQAANVVHEYFRGATK